MWGETECRWTDFVSAQWNYKCPSSSPVAAQSNCPLTALLPGNVSLMESHQCPFRHLEPLVFVGQNPHNFTVPNSRDLTLLRSRCLSHAHHHWFLVLQFSPRYFCFKGYKWESWWELPALSEGKGLIVQTSSDLSFLGLERALPSENMHHTWDSLSFLLIRVRHEAHISAEVVSGKYFILNKLLQHETLGCGMRAVQTNTSWQPIRFVCGDCRCDPKVNGSLLLLSGKAHKPSHTCEVPLALCYWMYWQTFGAWCFRVSLIFFLSISNENI